MICRETGDGILLIEQHEHALLAAALARRVGNALFAPPMPFPSVVMAIAQHDSAWPAYDARPIQNARGLPAHIFEFPVEIAIGAWSASVQSVQTADSYAGLLVSLHAMALAAYAAARHPAGNDPAALQRAFRIQQFLHRQAEIQQAIRLQLQMHIDLPLQCGLAEPGPFPDEDLLRANFHLLQFMDQMSLNLCFDRAIFAKIDPVYPRPGADSLSVRVARDADGTVRIDPWPFNAERLDLEVSAKQIVPGPFRDENQLRAACAAAPRRMIPLTLRAWQSP